MGIIFYCWRCSKIINQMRVTELILVFVPYRNLEDVLAKKYKIGSDFLRKNETYWTVFLDYHKLKRIQTR
jgi:hypothetical protein